MVDVPLTSLSEVNREREYLALITYLPRTSYWVVFSFFRQTRSIQNQLNESKGLVGYSMPAQLFGKKAWTLSVWEDEAALREFVRGAPHVHTMKNLRPQLEEARKFVRWKIPGSAIPPKWEEALRHLESG